MKKSSSIQHRKKTSAKKLAAKKTQWQQAHPKMGAHYSPRSLFRGLTVPYSDKPGQKYLHPERHRTIKEAT